MGFSLFFKLKTRKRETVDFRPIFDRPFKTMSHVPGPEPTVSRTKSRMALTRNLRRPTAYVQMLNEDFSKWALNEERAPLYKGSWREQAFQVDSTHPLDLEIGTGNGYHFAHMAQLSPERAVLGIEIKFKPLIQSIRRALRTGATNARILRYDANRLEDLFQQGELNNVYIHHPDPWLKKRQWKHRLIQTDFLKELHQMMRPGCFMDFKTDSRDYFEWSMDYFKNSPFQLERESWDLHSSPWQAENFVTQFERIFLAQGLPIHYARLAK
jgi:tRNA (guanine-N7-)-methyltransferase